MRKKVLVVQYSSENVDSVNLELENRLFYHLNKNHIPFGTHTIDELKADSTLLDNFTGVIYYYDPEVDFVPEGMPCVRLFGFTALPPRTVRVTTNDLQIAVHAADYLAAHKVKKAYFVIRNDCLYPEFLPSVPHHRWIFFQLHAAALGMSTELLTYEASNDEFQKTVERLIVAAPNQVGFFTFSDIFAFDLYLALKECGAWKDVQHRCVNSDTTMFLNQFWQKNFRIDLQFDHLVRRAISEIIRLHKSSESDVCETIMIDPVIRKCV